MAKRRLLPYESLSNKGVPYSKQHLRRLEEAGEFPRRVPVGAGRYGYVEDEVDAWLDARIAARDVGAASEIVQREEDGLFQIGLCDDAPGPFESRKHAADVAAREGRTSDADTA